MSGSQPQRCPQPRGNVGGGEGFGQTRGQQARKGVRPAEGVLVQNLDQAAFHRLLG